MAEIYNGNFDDLKGAANAFMNKYKQYIYTVALSSKYNPLQVKPL